MKKRRYLYQFIAIMAFVMFSFPLTMGKNVTNNDANEEKRADIIILNTLKSFGDLERKGVPFFHDAHTDALKNLNKSCDTCHLTEEISGKEGLSLKFKRLENKSRQEVMDIYHTNCIACHEEMSDTGAKTGPVEVCGECHKKYPEAVSSRQPIAFDKSLHFQHIEMNDENCSVCHHDNKKEGSCRYCHKGGENGKPVSMESASHLSCIGCHRELSGPVKCSGCHSPEEQQKIEKMDDIPRLQVEQPDFALMGMKNTGNLPATMAPVPFDHKAHEESQDTCRICHHAEIGSCSKSCHTTEGSKNGNMITSGQAMHKLDSEQSCLGCHEIQKNQKSCAGCHGQAQRTNSDVSCLACHIEIPKSAVEEKKKPESIAAKLIESRNTTADTIDDKDIPELVNINELSSEYGTVELLHRKHVDSLILDIKDNKLAGFFHNGEETLCLGCHHNSPASKTPPKCASCHSKESNDPASLVPDLKVAYHQQCMGCHDRMGIEKPKSTSCTECHKVIGVNKLNDF